MKKSRLSSMPSRANLRVADLLQIEPDSPSRLMNVKLPMLLFETIEKIARDIGVSKTAVVLALLADGLDTAQERIEFARR